jgi:hypothetical protein
MSEDQDLERRRLAYRRAGEAVARYTQGRRLPDLALEPPAAEAARAVGAPRGWQVDLGSRGRQRTELEILARWTGLLGESRACFADREPPEGWDPARGALADLGLRVTRGPEENDAYLEWMRRRARGLIDMPEIWAAVEAVAEALLTKGAICSREASEIIARVNRAHRQRIGFAGIFRNPR